MDIEEFMTAAFSPHGCVARPNQIIRVEGLVGRRDPLTELQQKIVTTAISLIHSTADLDPRKTEYKMSISDFLGECGFNQENIHNHLTSEIEKITRKGAWLYNANNRLLIRTQWFQSIVYTEDEITFEFTERILSLIIRFAHSNAEYHLVKGIQYKGRHTLAVFELIWAWKSKGVAEYSIPQLMQQLSLQHTRYSYGQLKLRVLEPSFEEIYAWDNAIYVRFSPAFSGRRVEGVRFEVTVGEEAKEMRKREPEFKVVLPEQKPAKLFQATSHLSEY